MATKKYLSLERLTEYDTLIKSKIDAGDASVKSYVDTEVAKKANSSHTHDDRYYTETEIDAKFDAIPESTMVVTFTKKSSNMLSSDKTIAEILEAHNNGTNVVGFYLNSLFVLSTVGNNRPAFVAYLGVWSSGTDGEKLTATAYRHIFMYDDSNIYYQQKIEQGLEIDRYNSLTTTQKTVIGAINELDEELGSHTHDDLYYTESEVDALIDGIPESTMIVNVTLSGNTYSADKTGAEIKAAIDAGKFVCVVHNKEIYYVTHCKDTNIHFQYQKVDITGVTSKLLSCVISSDRWSYGDGNFTYNDIANAKISSTLTTTNKTLVGAINELDSELDSHNHDDMYYTESEIDSKLSTINTSITNITNGSIVVKNAEHATSADSATTANSATSATKATQDGNGKVISSTYETKTDASTKLDEAKSYADSAVAKVKNDLLNGAGTAYDTLKELGDLIDENKDAIEALEIIASGKANATHGHAIADVSGLQAALDAKDEAIEAVLTEASNQDAVVLAEAQQSAKTYTDTVASGKANTTHSHAISDVSGLQSALDGKANSSHGTHVTFDSTNKPKMDGTAAFGTSTKVARADHVHPTDTSRAAKSDFDTHVASTVSHVTANERTAWNAKASTASATTATAGLMSAADKTKLNGIAEGANKYTHPTTSGNKHIPSGGASGQILRWSSDGTAVWGADNNTTYSNATTATAGLVKSGSTVTSTSGLTAVPIINGVPYYKNTTYSNATSATAGLVKVDTALSSSSTNPVQNKAVNTAITSLTSSVAANTSSITTLTNALAGFAEITSAEIQALFA